MLFKQEKMVKYTDQEIVESLKNRKGDAVRFVSEEYLPMIVYMVEKMDGSYNDAEDIFQEALIIIIKKIDSGELKLTAKFSTYLYAVCKNLWLYQLNKNKVDDKLQLEDVEETYEPDYDEKYDKALQQKQFWHYYEQLSDVCRKILRLYWLDLPVKKIAEDMGNTEKYIRKRKYECKKKLVELILKNKDRI